VPAELESIVRKLLQKDPSNRYESAADVRDDVRTVLNELSYGPWVVLGPNMQPGTPDPTASKPGAFDAWDDEGGQTRPPASFREGVENRLGAHQDAPLAGRDSERRVLQSLVSQTLRNDAGRVALVTGEEGVGKSRLVEWIEIRVREAGLMQVAKGSSAEAPSALSGVREAVADVLGLHDLAGERLRHEVESRLERAGLSDDEQVRLKRFLQPQFGSDLSEPSVDDLEEGEQQREQLFAAIEHLFRKMAGRRPVMLVLEDIARGDEVLASFLEHFTMGLKLSPYPLMLVVTARDAALSNASALNQTLHNVLNLAPDSVFRVELGRLSEEASIQLVQSLAPVSDELGRRIARRASGNPMLLHQLVQFLQEERRLVMRDGALELKDAGGLDEAIPGEVVELVRSRVDSISSRAARQILDRAAVLGSTFSYSLLRSMLEEEDDEGLVHSCDAAISELVSAGLLREEGETHEDLLAFDHGLIRDVVRREIDQPMPWRHLHRAAARAKQSFWSERIEDHSLEIAEHFREAEDQKGHCRFLARAAQSAARGSEPSRAAKLYRQALEIRRELDEAGDPGSEVPSTWRILLDLGHLMRRINDYDAAREHYREVLDADDLVAVARARWGLGLVAEHQGAFDDAEGWYEAASRAGRRARSEGMTDEAEAIDGFCLLGLGNIARQRGRFETASRLLFAALDRAEESGRTRLRINTLRALSDVLWRIGEGDEARSRLSQAMDLAEESGERRLVAENRMHAAVLYAEAGEPQRGRAEAASAVELFEGLNERHAAAKARRVIGEIDWRRGEFREAAKMLREAMKLYRMFEDRRGIARCRHLMAQVALTVGQAEQVRKLGRKAMKGYREMDDKRGIIQCGMLFGRLARNLGRVEDAESTFERAAEGFEKLGDIRGHMNARALQALALEELEAHEEVDTLLEDLLAKPLVGDLAEEPLATAFSELAELSADRNGERASQLHDIAAATRLRLGRSDAQ
jgi:tetratricopeptide (TPR) repeat protein